MNFGLIVGEALLGLRRNLSMVISVVLVTFVSLTFVGAAILMQTQISTMRAYWGEKAEVTVYMCSPLSTAPSCVGGEASQEQIDKVKQSLEGDALAPLISEVRFQTKEDAYQDIVDQLGDEQASVIGVENTSVDFRITMKDPQQSDVITEAFTGEAGVDAVKDQRKLLDPLFSALTVATYIAVGVAALMLIAAVLLIATTIRLSAYARRKEIGIMRLVGASNSSIQTPFVLEGVFAAFLGSALASAAVLAGVHFGVEGYLADRVPFMRPLVGMQDAVFVVPVLIGIGIVLSALSAGFAIRRWLRT
ncbi:permease-like cell division protein FtsX [Microbacterium sp. ARD32]|uniref:permease-like cell division protein FtsX n=1 Tax=Microbacterium sp. ARD32 TaxID=2962577 RepID=UPI002880EA74|nr:permease-like cell division protein FtsX [Microbacterium sp. ARD32]MDT0158615.1 permease-like cell division protein FtsX [Microbacterium sp. ARD32]